jgi:hypothetical protein
MSGQVDVSSRDGIKSSVCVSLSRSCIIVLVTWLQEGGLKVGSKASRYNDLEHADRRGLLDRKIIVMECMQSDAGGTKKKWSENAG